MQSFFDCDTLLQRNFARRVKSIDVHVGGEAARIIVSGVGPFPSPSTTAEKRQYFMEHYDQVRQLLTREPRGHRDMFAACVVEPSSLTSKFGGGGAAMSQSKDISTSAVEEKTTSGPTTHGETTTTNGSAFGLIFMDARRYPYLCGHATIAAITCLVESAAVQVPETGEVTVDTPSGPLTASVKVKSEKREGEIPTRKIVESVGIKMVPSFVQSDNVSVTCDGHQYHRCSLVCVGGFFIMIPMEEALGGSNNKKIVPENFVFLRDLGMKLIAAANQQFSVRHPTRPEVRTVDVAEFYSSDKEKVGNLTAGTSFVVYGEAHIDRSPCGTGTAAKATLMHHRGTLSLNEGFIQRSPLGTTFLGRVVRENVRIGETKEGDASVTECKGVHESVRGNTTMPDDDSDLSCREDGVIVEVRGSGYVTGIHEFLLSPEDPFPEGYLI